MFIDVIISREYIWVEEMGTHETRDWRRTTSPDLLRPRVQWEPPFKSHSSTHSSSLSSPGRELNGMQWMIKTSEIACKFQCVWCAAQGILMRFSDWELQGEGGWQSHSGRRLLFFARPHLSIEWLLHRGRDYISLTLHRKGRQEDRQRGGKKNKVTMAVLSCIRRGCFAMHKNPSLNCLSPRGCCTTWQAMPFDMVYPISSVWTKDNVMLLIV